MHRRILTRTSFLLTRLLRGATVNILDFLIDILISTHTPLARRDAKDKDAEKRAKISTHTPLARRDDITEFFTKVDSISTHTPLARRDLY